MKLPALNVVIANKPVLTICLVFFIVCFLLSALIPPMQSPDETDHIKRAYLLSRGVIFLDAPAGSSSGGRIDTGLMEYINACFEIAGRPDIKLSMMQLDYLKKIKWTGKYDFSVTPGTGYYFPAIYIPQAAGLFLGKIMGLTIDRSYRLVRLLTLLTVMIFFFLAFNFFFPGPLVFAFLVIPMSLFQFSSASIDGVSTAAAVLALSAFMKIISEREKTDSGLLYILCGSIMLVASCRFHLMSLILLLFYLYYATREKKYLKAAGITALFVFLWTIIALLTTVDNRVDIGASAFKILIYHVSNPVRFLRITIATLVYKDIYYNMYTYANYLAFYRESFLGLLGWLDTPFLKSTYFYLFYLLLLIGILNIPVKQIKTGWQTRSVLLLCSAVSFLLVFLALVIAANKHPASIVHGIQGRYFIVPAILAAYALGENGAIYISRLKKAAFALLIIFFLYSVYSTADLLIVRYYCEHPERTYLLKNK